MSSLVNPIRALIRYAGVSNITVFLPLIASMAITGRWPQVWYEFWFIVTSAVVFTIFAVDAIGLWYYLRKKNSSLQNIWTLVIKYGVSWDYLAQLETRIRPHIQLAEKHCPELIVSRVWRAALAKEDLIALTVLAEDSLRPKRKAIERSERRVAEKVLEVERLCASLKELDVDDAHISGALGKGVEALRDLLKHREYVRALQVRAELASVRSVVDTHLKSGTVEETSAYIAKAERLIGRAQKFGIEEAVRACLAQADMPGAEEMIRNASLAAHHEEVVLGLRNKIGKLGASARAAIDAEIAKLASHTPGSREYRKLVHELQRRIE